MGRHGASHRLDVSHPEIIRKVRKAGYAAIPTAQLGNFIGDMVVPVCGVNLIFELKPAGWKGPRNERERKQQEARRLWRAAGGQVNTCTTFEQVMAVIHETEKKYGMA